MGKHRDLLRTLDFNGVHSGDVLAAAYFRQSAVAIRVSEGEADYYRRLYEVTDSRLIQANIAARQLEEQNLLLRHELERLSAPVRQMLADDIGIDPRLPGDPS